MQRSEPCFLDQLRTSAEDITEYYRQQGICSGQDCDRFMQQVCFRGTMLRNLVLYNPNDLIYKLFCKCRSSTCPHLALSYTATSTFFSYT